MTRHRDFHAAAERVAVNCRHEWFGRVLHAAEERMRPRRPAQCVLRRLQQVEHLDVRSGDERRAAADQHDGVGRRVGVRALHALVDRFPHRGTERVDRRIVDGQDRDAFGDVVANNVSHKRF
jgi:hypothetical protein